jgi:signal transduction histidine kinase
MADARPLPPTQHRTFIPRSLALKLVLAFGVVSVFGIGLADLLAHQVTVRQFEQVFLDMNRADYIAVVTDYYRTRGSWDGVDDAIRRQSQRRPGESPPPSPFGLADAGGTVVSPAAPYRVGDRLGPDALGAGYAVEIGGKRIGTVLDAARRPTLSTREQAYLTSTNRALSLAAIGAVALAVCLGALLARGLTRPVRDLTRALEAVARGELRQELPVRSGDEVGDLTRAFNRMSADLARADALRQQMTADIAHDLRAPLSVIAGYVESMRDGVLPATPERFDAMHTEVQHLVHLVEDLRTLSLADADELPIHRQITPAHALLCRASAAFAPQAVERGVALCVEDVAAPVDIDVDPERMSQVLGNLVSNALRHTPSGGRIALSAGSRGDEVILTVADTGEGIPPEVLPHIFERLYRGDHARTDPGTESGLGLAIARSLVTAHGGIIMAASAGAGQGATFTICLPRSASTIAPPGAAHPPRRAR